jgi:hypothetical protein
MTEMGELKGDVADGEGEDWKCAGSESGDETPAEETTALTSAKMLLSFRRDL